MSNEVATISASGSGLLAVIRAAAGAADPLMERRLSQAWRIGGLSRLRGREDEHAARRLLRLTPDREKLEEQREALVKASYGVATEQEREQMFAAIIDRLPSSRWIENKVFYLEGLVEDTEGYSGEVIFTAARRIRRENPNPPSPAEFIKQADTARHDYLRALKATITLIDRRLEAEDIIWELEVEAGVDAELAAVKVTGRRLPTGFDDALPF